MDFLDFKKLLFDKINEIKNNNLFESKDLIKIFDI
jgi:hypothetical protein